MTSPITIPFPYDELPALESLPLKTQQAILSTIYDNWKNGIKLKNSTGNEIGVQHPLPTDGDSVYYKDIWVEESVFTDWSGDITDLFDNLHSQITNVTTDNPKTIVVHFNRTIISNAIGLGNTGSGDFSNVLIKIRNSGNVDTTVVDESADSTKHTTKTFQLPVTAGFNALVIEFHTTDTITLSNCVILKAISTIARLQGVDSDSMVQNVKVTQDGNLAISDNSSGLAIAKGDVTKSTSLRKFGQNNNLNTATYEDIWDNGGIYPYPDDNTSPITYINSDDNTDTQPIEIQGLDINGSLIIQTITLSGTTSVILTTPLWRVFRLKNMQTSINPNLATNNVAGNVQVINTGDTIIYAQIQNGNNQTLMALYTIPLGFTGYLLQGTNGIIGTTRAYSVDGKLFMREYGKVQQLKKTFGLSTDGTGYIVVPFPIAGKIPALTDIRVQAISSANGGGINTTFDINLIED